MARILSVTALPFAFVLSASAPQTDTDSSVILAQAYGGICVTQWGNCEVPPQPVGSVCFCGSAQGFVGE